MAKTLAQVQAALAEVYDGQTFEKDGRTYIPWNVALKEAIEVFGADGFDITVRSVKREGDGYVAIVALTVYTSDGRSITREGVGYNDVTTTKSGAEMVDTAIKGATSDALNRALKLFGPRFGLNLYDRETSGSRGGGASKSSGGGKWSDRPALDALSEKQLGVLTGKAGYTEKALAEMTAGEAKEKLDAYFSDGVKAPTAKAAAKRRTPDDEEDDLGF